MCYRTLARFSRGRNAEAAAGSLTASGGPVGYDLDPMSVEPRSYDSALIWARSLTKRFGDFVAVDAIDFDVAKGESFGFLGPNGAGKTSTMRMIGCVSPVSDGALEVLGQDPRRDGPSIRARIGVVPQQDTLDTELTVRENLVIYGRYFGMSRAECRRRADELLEFTQLTDRANDPVEPLSGGMKYIISKNRPWKANERIVQVWPCVLKSGPPTPTGLPALTGRTTHTRPRYAIRAVAPAGSGNM